MATASVNIVGKVLFLIVLLLVYTTGFHRHIGAIDRKTLVCGRRMSHLCAGSQRPPRRTTSRLADSTSLKSTEVAANRRSVLKTKLFARAAACDRGFGASPRDRKEISSIVEELQKLSPESVPTRGLYPYKFPLQKVHTEVDSSNNQHEKANNVPSESVQAAEFSQVSFTGEEEVQPVSDESKTSGDISRVDTSAIAAVTVSVPVDVTDVAAASEPPLEQSGLDYNNNNELKSYWPNAAQVSKAKLQSEVAQPRLDWSPATVVSKQQQIGAETETPTSTAVSNKPPSVAPSDVKETESKGKAPSHAHKCSNKAAASTGSSNGVSSTAVEGEDVPLEGVWQMVYTTALDVLSLAANPFTIVQGIYQVLTPDGSSVNIIDLAPRTQALLPIQLQRSTNTVTRARVYTSARARSESRVGLTFLRAELAPQAFLNIDVSKSRFFPALGVTFPQVPSRWLKSKKTVSSTSAGADVDADADAAEEQREYRGPGFFDVLYVDEDLLIIRQGEPGGIFVSVRRDEPVSNFIPDDVKNGRKIRPGIYRYRDDNK